MTPRSRHSRSILIAILALCIILPPIIFTSLLFTTTLGNLPRLILYRVTFPFLERSVCRLRKLLIGDAHRPDEDSCGPLPRLLSNLSLNQQHYDDEWVTASEVVARAHAQLHFTPRVILLSSTLASDKEFIGSSHKGTSLLFSEQGECISDNGIRFWLLAGQSLANIGVLETRHHIHLIDAAEQPATLLKALDDLAFVLPPQCRRKAIKSIYISHFHTDHTGGIGGGPTWNRKLSADKPRVVSHESTVKLLSEFLVTSPQAKYRRAVKQFGSSPFLSHAVEGRPSVISAGIGGRFGLVEASEEAGNPVAYPTHTWSGEEKVVSIGTHTMTMLRCPGETADQICFWVPQLSLFYISDNFYYAFPNIYPLRGGVFRSPLPWIASLDSFLKRYSGRTDVLAMGHTSPVFGSALIRLLVMRYKDAIKFVYDQTIRLLNHKSDADEIASDVASLFWTVVPKLGNTPFEKGADMRAAAALLADPIMPFYGQLQWASKAVFTHEMGWFNGDARQINEHRFPRHKRRARLAALMNGGRSLREAAVTALADEECQWALELTDIALSPFEERGIRTTQPSACGWPSDEEEVAQTDAATRDVYADWLASVCPKPGAETGQVETSQALVDETRQDKEEMTDCRRFDAADDSQQLPLFRCLRREALYCLARRELPASGRNWYLFEALTQKEKALEEVGAISAAKILRDAYLTTVPDLQTVLLSFPSRYEPGLLSWAHVPTTIWLEFGKRESREDEGRDPDGLQPVVAVDAISTTYEIVSRNAVLTVKEVEFDDIDWATRAETRFIHMEMTWSGFRGLLIRNKGPMTLMATGDLSVPTEKSRDEHGRAVSYLHRIRLLLDVFELFLSIEQK